MRLLPVLIAAASLAVRAEASPQRPAHAIRAARGARRLTDVAALPVTDPGARLCYEGSIDRGQGNEDWNWGVYRDAHGDWVLLEADGPGCIFNFVQHRYVTDCEAPVFRFYFEGESEPRLAITPADFGVRSPLLPPLAGVQKWQGKWRHGPTDKLQDFSIVRSFVPMEFTNGVRITSSVRLHGGEPGGWGHVQYHLYPSAAGLATFDPSADFAALARACERPLDAGHDATADTPAGELAAGASACLFEHAGRGTVTAVSLALPAFEQSQLTNLWLSLSFDGEERVRAPVGTFFGNEQSCIKNEADRTGYDFETALLTFDLSRKGALRLENRFPMPFWRNARIVLENRGAVPVRTGAACVRTNSRLAYDRRTAGHFTATAYLPPTRNRRFRNAVLGQGVGCGHVVYSVITGHGFTEKACEGDVRLYLDNLAAPAAQSDGSESWGCWGMGFGHAPKSHLFSFYNSPDRLGPWSLCRLNVTDACPFRHVFRLEIEHGPDNLEERSSHSGQVFYYGRGNADRDGTETPRAPSRPLEDIVDAAFAGHWKYGFSEKTSLLHGCPTNAVKPLSVRASALEVVEAEAR